MSVDQKIVAGKIYQDRAYRCEHRNLCGTKVPERAAVCLSQTDGDQADQDYMHIINADGKCLCGIRRITFSHQEQVAQRR